MNNTAR